MRALHDNIIIVTSTLLQEIDEHSSGVYMQLDKELATNLPQIPYMLTSKTCVKMHNQMYVQTNVDPHKTTIIASSLWHGLRFYAYK